MVFRILSCVGSLLLRSNSQTLAAMKDIFNSKSYVLISFRKYMLKLITCLEPHELKKLDANDISSLQKTTQCPQIRKELRDLSSRVLVKWVKVLNDMGNQPDNKYFRRNRLLNRDFETLLRSHHLWYPVATCGAQLSSTPSFYLQGNCT
jgi:hypothetical protein